ncbi:MAG: hypothetical protein JO281_05745 [Pseudonocardiales bacterium]|nr:hypothetical protein [Pseudonocardiales bacterium]
MSVARLMREGIRLSFMLIYITPQQALVDLGAAPAPDDDRVPLEEIVAHEASERGITGTVLVDTR